MTFDRPVTPWNVEETRDKLRGREDFLHDEHLRDIDRDLVAIKMYMRTLEEDLKDAQVEINKWRRRVDRARPGEPNWWKHY